MAKHSETERHILGLFSNLDSFKFNGNDYKIEKLGKPRPSKGECKTDIYLLVIDQLENRKEFKISIKQDNADFLENKISHERALEIFGEDLDSILYNSINAIKSSFLDEPTINFNKYKRTEPNCMKIGWKFELVNKSGGDKSGELLLTNGQKIDIYSGSNLNDSKKNSKVNGEVILNSGVANYILEVDRLTDDINFYLDNLIKIEDYAINQKIYFACKAVNFRIDAGKWDGDRPLSVFCDWSLDSDNKIKVQHIFDQPLKVKANQIGNSLRKILIDLGIDKNNFGEIKNSLSSSVILKE